MLIFSHMAQTPLLNTLVGSIQNMIVFMIKSNKYKSDHPHHVVIKHRAINTSTTYPRIQVGFDLWCLVTIVIKHPKIWQYILFFKCFYKRSMLRSF